MVFNSEAGQSFKVCWFTFEWGICQAALRAILPIVREYVCLRGCAGVYAEGTAVRGG